MDREAFQNWWGLHLRVAKGLPLSSDETTVYEAGRRQLETDEILNEVQSARSDREQLQALETERSTLERRRKLLDHEIETLSSTKHLSY